MSVGKAGVWGVNGDDDIFYRHGTSVDPSRLVVKIFLTNLNDINQISSEGTGWARIDGGLSYVDVPFAGKADKEMWGVNSEGQIFRKIWSNKNEIYPSLERILGREMKQLSVAERRVWAVAKDGTIWQAEVAQRG